MAYPDENPTPDFRYDFDSRFWIEHPWRPLKASHTMAKIWTCDRFRVQVYWFTQLGLDCNGQVQKTVAVFWDGTGYLDPKYSNSKYPTQMFVTDPESTIYMHGNDEGQLLIVVRKGDAYIKYVFRQDGSRSVNDGPFLPYLEWSYMDDSFMKITIYDIEPPAYRIYQWGLPPESQRGRPPNCDVKGNWEDSKKGPREEKLTDPLVLDLDGDGLKTISTQEGILF